MALVAHGSGQLAVTRHYNHNVPLKPHKQKMMVEITGPSIEPDKTAYLDLVVVLDTSESMKGQKIEYMKQAAEFVIKRMGTMDTLTFVPFSSKAGMPSAVLPQYMSDEAKRDARRFVKALTAQGDAGDIIKDGLDRAIRILRRRIDGTGRAAGVFLMSGGKKHIGGGAKVLSGVNLRHLPVFTFGFGHEDDRDLLYHIASKSNGGTYHNTRRWEGKNRLLLYFAKVLGILRDVSALSLTVTLKPHAGVTLERPDAGNYLVTKGANGSSYTIYFGELARKEHRKIIIEIQLPAVSHSESAKTVMDVECSYRLPRQSPSSSTTKQIFLIKMARDRNAPPHDTLSRHVKAELARRDQAKRIGKMRTLADDKKFDEAMNELAKARNAFSGIRSMLKEVDVELESALSLELRQLENLLVSHKVYDDDRGSAYVRAAILSHGHQRFAARGCPEDVKLYAALPRMQAYSKEAGELIGI